MYYERKRRNIEKIIMYSCLIIIIALLAIIIVKLMDNNNDTIASSNDYVAKKIELTENTEIEIDNGVQSIISTATESIVGISKLKENGTSIFVNNAEEKLGLGSGVIVTDNGYIVTNQHVVRK